MLNLVILNAGPSSEFQSKFIHSKYHFILIGQAAQSLVFTMAQWRYGWFGTVLKLRIQMNVIIMRSMSMIIMAMIAYGVYKTCNIEIHRCANANRLTRSLVAPYRVLFVLNKLSSRKQANVALLGVLPWSGRIDPALKSEDLNQKRTWWAIMFLSCLNWAVDPRSIIIVYVMCLSHTRGKVITKRQCLLVWIRTLCNDRS